jgi:hypothetical protein
LNSSELLPKLPNTGVFEVNAYLEQYTNPMSFIQNGRHKSHEPTMLWQYKIAGSNDPTSGEWKSFSSNEQMTLERNRAIGITTMPLEIDGQLCEINFAAMNRRIISTGLELPIDRRPGNGLFKFREWFNLCLFPVAKDERDNLLVENFEPFLEFVRTIFPLLVEIGSNSTCSNLRYDSVRVMTRMIYAVQSHDSLLSFLKEAHLASYISGTLSSSKNVALVALAIQLVSVLLEKMPDLYVPLFESEGVFFELKRKATASPMKKTPVKSTHSMSPSLSRHTHSGSSTPTIDRHASRSQPVDSTRYDNAQLDSPAAAALSRLLQHQVFQQSSVDTQISNAIAAVAGSSANQSNAVRYAPVQSFGLDVLNSRSVLPNLFLSAGSLQVRLHACLF